MCLQVVISERLVYIPRVQIGNAGEVILVQHVRELLLDQVRGGPLDEALPEQQVGKQFSLGGHPRDLRGLPLAHRHLEHSDVELGLPDRVGG